MKKSGKGFHIFADFLIAHKNRQRNTILERVQLCTPPLNAPWQFQSNWKLSLVRVKRWEWHWQTRVVTFCFPQKIKALVTKPTTDMYLSDYFQTLSRSEFLRFLGTWARFVLTHASSGHKKCTHINADHLEKTCEKVRVTFLENVASPNNVPCS